MLALNSIAYFEMWSFYLVEANKDYHRIEGNLQTTPLGGGGGKVYTEKVYTPIYTEPTTTRSKWVDPWESPQTRRPSSTNTKRWPDYTDRYPNYNQPVTPWKPMTPFPTDYYRTTDDYPTPPWPIRTQSPKRTTTIATTTTTTTTTLPPSEYLNFVIITYQHMCPRCMYVLIIPIIG